ncbi:MAG TPA: hypothetical protein VID48_07625 [Solirubrobacteraceae bacterium]
MPVTLPPPQATPSAPVEVKDGVIEEARRRQRHRRTASTALGAGAVVVAISALLIGGGGKGSSGAAGEPSSARPLKLALVHGRAFVGGQPALLGVTPSLQAGNVGVCVRVASHGGCNGPPPTVGDPVYGEDGYSPEEKVGPEGEIDALFTGPGVAAVRVAHLGSFPVHHVAGLPPGSSEVVFYRSPGSRGTVLNPGMSPTILQGFEHARKGPALTETLLDASGRVIPVPAHGPPTFTLANSYWQGAEKPPAQGRCAMSSSFPGARTGWGQVADRIAGDPAVTVPAWLTCLHVWFSAGGANFETAVLLDARSPGIAPAPLWGAIPVPGHPGIVEIPPVQREIHFRIPKRSPAQVARELATDTKKVGRARAIEDVRPAEQLSGKATFWDVFIPPTVARRVGPAWVLVRYGNSLAQRIAFLQALHVTKIKLPHG